MTLSQLFAAVLLLGALLTTATWLDWPAIVLSVEAVRESIAHLLLPVADRLTL